MAPSTITQKVAARYRLNPDARIVGSVRWRTYVVLWSTVVLLSFVTVLRQEDNLGFSYLRTEQLNRHQAVLDHTAPSPWRYRVLSDYILAPVIKLATSAHIPQPIPIAFLTFRVLQNLAIFLMACAFYRNIGLSHRLSLVGITILAFCMMNALNNSDLCFNTYTDLFFYLLAAWMVLKNEYSFFLVLVALAALNRETSGLMCVLPLAPLLAEPKRTWSLRRKEAAMTALALALYGLIFVALRILIGPDQNRNDWQADWGYRVGIHQLIVNLTSKRSVLWVTATFSALPLLMLLNWRGMPAVLRNFAWLLLPAWLTIHFLTACVNETRLFLVTIAVVIIPAALYPRFAEEGAQTTPAIAAVISEPPH